MNNKKDLIYLHIAVLLFGFAGVIGKWVSLPAIIVTLGRVLFSSIFLLVLLLIKKQRIALDNKKDYLYMAIAGIIMAVHWTCFMQSIQVSSVAIGTITFASFPLFVTFLEPLLFKEKLTIKNIILALMMLMGVMILVPFNNLSGNITLGIIYGMISSFTYALLSLMNRYLTNSYQGTLICFYEQFIATIVLLPTLFIVSFTTTVNELLIIVVLGVLCTAIAHSLYVTSLTRVKVQTAGIISGMESVYSIILAMLILQTMPTIRELIGGLVILSVTIYTTATKRGCNE